MLKYMMKSNALRHLLLLTLLCFSSFSSLHSADPRREQVIETAQPEGSLIPPDIGPGYTINFNNVSIIEYIKFISKIGGVNFVYNEAELKFNVTIVSEEPTSMVNVMSALVQVLKINGFGLVEQGNNLLITKSGSVRQIATVVSQESPLEGSHIPPIMTRVFKIKNANPSSLASLLAPLLSVDAILEVSAETRHIIITDITQNIEQVQKLLLTLDAAKSPLSIDSYVTRNNTPEGLIGLANQIITPISEGNPVIYVPQDKTNTIFIVSTPYLIEKSIMIFEDLDVPPSLTRKFAGPITGKNILIYHILNKPADVLQAAIKQLESNLNQMGPSSQDLVQTLSTMRYIRESHSLVFMGDPQSLDEVRSILGDLDVPYTDAELEYIKGGFYIYKIQHGDEEQISRSLEKLVDNLKKSPYPDRDLISTIETMKWIKENNSLMFTGDQRSIDKLKQILPTFDIPLHEGKTSSKLPLSNDFYVYTPKFQSGEELLKQVQDVYKSLQTSNLADPAFLHALNSAKWVASTHSLVFTGDPQSLDRIHALLATMDHPKGPPTEEITTYVYKPKFVPASYIEQGLQKLGKTLSKDDPLTSTIDNSKYIKETHSFVFQGPVSAVDRIKEIISTMDSEEVAAQLDESKPGYFVYKLQAAPGSFVIKQLDETAKTLKGSNVEEKQLIDAIHDIQWNQGTNSLVLTGPKETLEKLKTLIAKYDISTPDNQASQFYLYRPRTMSAAQYLKHVENAASEMDTVGLTDSELIHSLKTARLVSNGTAILFAGPPQTIDKIRELAPTFDASQEAKATQFFVYKPISMPAKKFKENMLSAAADLENSKLNDPQLIQALQSASIVSDGQSVMFTGTPEAIDKLRVMVPSFDEERQSQKPNKIFLFTPTYRSSEDIIKAAKHAANEIENAKIADPELVSALESGKIVAHGRSVIFTGTPAAIQKLETVVPTFDTKKPIASQYFVYKPINMPAKELRSRMVQAADGFKSSGLDDPDLIAALESAQVTPGGNAVMFTGTPEAITSIKDMVNKFDLHQEKPQETSDFVIYKPKNVTPDTLRRHARIAAQDLESSGLTDPYFISTLNNTRLVSGGTGVLFTGTPEAIAKVRDILPSLDQVKDDGSKQVGKTTFLVYKIKYVQGPVLMGYLRNMATDLQRAGSTETDLIDTLNNMRYVKETNSIIFTGTESVLNRAQSLAEEFDTPELAQEAPPREPTGFLIYKPKYVPGQQLITILRDFEQNLIQSGVSDPSFFDAINHLKWMENVSSILISGNDDDTKKIYSLLERFDIPGPGIAGEETGIESISDMSFLIYKLQYHSGIEIQSAIQKIGKDLAKIQNDKVNQGLVAAINALQWIEVTNSLISTGQSDALAKLKELIKSIDVPLKQVFVEILVLETSISNALNFGLRWGSQGVYREKFAYATGAFPQQPASGDTDPLGDFNSNLNNVVDATTTPTGSMIPFSSGFDLGVIGDIILHKGKSYFALGSLIDAIKGDNDTTVALNQKVITQDNKNATIFVGQNIPYTGSIVNNQGSSTVTQSNIEYRDVGVSLSITPQIGENDTVTMSINEEITEDLQGSGNTSNPNVLTGITTSKTTTQTSVTVPDKSFLVLSGQIDNSIARNRTSIPCLGGLPLIGAAFTQNDTLDANNSIIIFVRPHIIKSFDVYKEITEHQEALHRAQTDDEEAFDAGLELVKTPDDY